MDYENMTQCERVVAYIRAFGPITPYQAWQELGISRLAARINELKKEGYLIDKRNVKVQNRFGEDLTVAQYSLAS